METMDKDSKSISEKAWQIDLLTEVLPLTSVLGWPFDPGPPKTGMFPVHLCQRAQVVISALT